MYSHVIVSMVMLIFSQIAKVDIKEFKRGRTLPVCTIELEWIGSGEPKRLSHKVNIIGAQKPNNYFYMRYSPQECEFVHVYCVWMFVWLLCSFCSQTNLLPTPPAKKVMMYTNTQQAVNDIHVLYHSPLK